MQIVFDWILKICSSNCLAVCTRTRFWSSVKIWRIHLAEIFCSFKIRFQMKCTLAIYQQLWRYSFGSVTICHHFQLFSGLLRHLLCLSQVGLIMLHLGRTQCRNFFFHLKRKKSKNLNYWLLKMVLRLWFRYKESHNDFAIKK